MYFRSATPLHLHKCIVRFVSDSSVSYYTDLNTCLLTLITKKISHTKRIGTFLTVWVLVGSSDVLVAAYPGCPGLQAA